MIKFIPRLFLPSAIVLLTFLSGCVTQSYENNNETPVVVNNSNNNELAMGRITLGLGYLQMGNTSQAKLNLEKAKGFAPNLSEVYTAFAHYYDVVGELKLAINSYEKALSINPENPDTLNNYGVFLCRNEEYAASEKYTLKAIAIPTYLMVSQSYENLALCQLKADEFVKAEKYFTKSIQHSPNRATALLQMVRLQYALSDYKSAQQYLARYEKATRRFSPEALALAFKVYEKQRNRRIAKNYASMLVKMFPNSYQAKQYILNGLVHIEADDLAKAYQASTIGSTGSPSTKRVVVLSPNKPRKNFPKVKIAKEKVINEKTTKKETVTESVVAQNSPSKSITDYELKVHVVEKGDSLFSISKRYNINMNTLERWNDLSREDILILKRKLYISVPLHLNPPPVYNATKNTRKEKTQ